MEYDSNRDQIRIMHETTDFIDKDILEIGCGDGSNSLHLARDARSYTAVDPDEDAIAMAGSLDQPQTPSVRFKTGSGQCLEFAENSFDLILFTLSLHHQESLTALGEAARVLRPDGRVLVVEPRPDSDFQRFFNLFDDETNALGAAADALHSGPLTLIHHDQFTVTAEFEDTRDLFSYDFDREHIGPEDNDRILHLLEETCGLPAHPSDRITIRDTLNISLLWH